MGTRPEVDTGADRVGAVKGLRQRAGHTFGFLPHAWRPQVSRAGLLLAAICISSMRNSGAAKPRLRSTARPDGQIPGYHFFAFSK